MSDLSTSEVLSKLNLEGPYWRGVIECALLGDVSRAIEICEHVRPRYEWTLKRNRACLKHNVISLLDVDWIRAKNTANALVLCVLKTKS